ncbi:MAG: hypothetical protein K2O18_04035 [Oscillospiraceae bacterium]|nr:hypothetical protein [Oscillospiraceae bacterium]
MKTVLIAAILAVGFVLGYLICLIVVRQQLQDRKRSRLKSPPNKLLRSVTRLIFVTTQVSALVWVFTSYGIAIYSTVQLEQVYTMAELSEPAIHTILGVGFLKVLENIFEHNNGGVFGCTKESGEDSL